MLKTDRALVSEGKLRIKLESDGTVLDVDEDDVEKVSGDAAADLIPTPGS